MGLRNDYRAYGPPREGEKDGDQVGNGLIEGRPSRDNEEDQSKVWETAWMFLVPKRLGRKASGGQGVHVIDGKKISNEKCAEEKSECRWYPQNSCERGCVSGVRGKASQEKKMKFRDREEKDVEHSERSENQEDPKNESPPRRHRGEEKKKRFPVRRGGHDS